MPRKKHASANHESGRLTPLPLEEGGGVREFRDGIRDNAKFALILYSLSVCSIARGQSRDAQ